jgi:precorrin-6B methylase 2
MENPYQENGEFVPWIASGAVEFIESVLTKESVVCEVGSGGSTLWFSKLAGRVISYENDQNWYDCVNKHIKAAGFNNVDLVFTATQDFILPEKFDLVLIDSKGFGDRTDAVKKLYPYLKFGGYLVVDDMEVFDRYRLIGEILGKPNYIFKGRNLMPESQTETAIWIKS